MIFVGSQKESGRVREAILSQELMPETTNEAHRQQAFPLWDFLVSTPYQSLNVSPAILVDFKDPFAHCIDTDRHETDMN